MTYENSQRKKKMKAGDFFILLRRVERGVVIIQGLLFSFLILFLKRQCFANSPQKCLFILCLFEETNSAIDNCIHLLYIHNVQ